MLVATAVEYLIRRARSGGGVKFLGTVAEDVGGGGTHEKLIDAAFPTILELLLVPPQPILDLLPLPPLHFLNLTLLGFRFGFDFGSGDDGDDS